MRILLISTRFYPHVGGVEKVVESLAGEFSKNGHDTVVLASMTASLAKVESGLNPFKNFKLKRIWMAVPRSPMGYLAFVLRFPISVYKLVIFLKDFNPDVINYHFPDDSSLYIWITKFFIKKPLIVNIHGNDIQIFAYKKFYRFWIKSILNASTYIIVNSNYMKDQVIKFDESLQNKITLLPNGLNLNEFNEVPAQKYFNNAYIFFVGRLVHKKGADILVKAFKKASIPDLKLLIEGKGEELDSIKKLVNDLKIEDKIKMTEATLSDTAKISYMKGALFGVMPSRVEPFGIVSLEFLAAGVPLIASKIGGLLNLLEDNQTCLFFENENVDDLASKIKLMYKNTGIRMKLSVNGLEAVEKYSWHRISGDYINIFIGTTSS